MDPLMEGLNEPQREAVLHVAGPLVVFAGAGSGKTRVITHRVAHLLAEHDVPPWRVLSVTFTNKAASEMRERLDRLVPGGRARDLWVGTFHATCARLLRRHAEEIGIRRDFTIYDDADQKAMVARILRDLDLDERRYAPKQVAGQINRAKQEVIGAADYQAEDHYSEQVRRVYELYEVRMEASGALDFGDLIYRLVVAIEGDPELQSRIAGRFDHVLVDEFQDTNRVQFRLLQALAKAHQNLCVVGDDDQSIYRWRGADRRNILDFRQTFPRAHVVKLEQNYRSTQRILRVANAVISANIDREPKVLWTANDEGAPVLVARCEDERDEAQMLARAATELATRGGSLEDAVIFYRTHAQSRVIEEELRGANVAYRVVGGTRFYDRAEVKDVLAYLRLLHNPDDDVSLLRIINTPPRGIGKTTVERVLEVAAEQGRGVWAVLADPASLSSLGTGPRKKLHEFVQIVEALRDRAETDGLVDLTEAAITRSGYLAKLQSDDTPESEARIENIRELVGSVAEFEEAQPDATLADFLELVTLQTSADEVQGEQHLTLMTIHAAKGLEFPMVFVAGLEEGMFPLRGSDLFEDPEEIEEERRLAYVAFTRAEQRLVLSWTGIRRIYGQMRVNEPSRFLRELPAQDVEEVGRPPSRAARNRYREGRVGGLGSSGYGSMPAPAEGPPSSSESYVDYSEGSDLEGEMFQIGRPVRHATFGVGKVTQITGDVPPRVVVDFPSVGRKKIVATFLKPA